MKVILLFIWLVMVFTHYSYAQATDTITIKTFAKENPVVQFNYREPANYDITLKSKYRLLIYFGGAILPARTGLRASLGGIGAIKTDLLYPI